MRTTSIATLTFLLTPAITFALSFDGERTYSDVRPASPELAGINMLSDLGVVQGYANGKFLPTRQINRAEFLKIAMAAVSKHPDVTKRPEFDMPKIAEASDPYCFDDVLVGDWFSSYVCTAFSMGVVRGNPDGLFHPERTVSYGEALKMLTLLYGYEIYSMQSVDWAEPYYRSASARSVDLPVTITLDAPLTRAMSARLIAAFVAESEGRLTDLRRAEAGQYGVTHSSEASQSVSSSTESQSSISSSTQSSMSESPSFTVPVTSHFLLVGQTSDAIADMKVRSSGEPARIASVQVKIVSEASSIEALELVNPLDGSVIVSLPRRQTTDLADYKLTYEAQVDLTRQARIPADTDVLLVLRARLRGLDNNGVSDQLVQVRSMSITLVGEVTNATTNIPAFGPYPKHQTSFGRIASVTRVSPLRSPIRSGTGLTLTSFELRAESIATKSVALEEVMFALQKTGQLSLQHFRLSPRGDARSILCSMSGDGLTISCIDTEGLLQIPSASSLVLDLKADVALPAGATNASLQADIAFSGSPSTLGSIRWTDHSGHFRWVEGAEPVARGTRWQ